MGLNKTTVIKNYGALFKVKIKQQYDSKLSSIKFVFKKLNLSILLCIILLSLCSVGVLAKNSNLKLLAASELEDGTIVGGLADLYLEVRPGNGGIFIDTYPLSKFDTQLSIRFAKDMACRFASVDCSKYDFLYTIRARSNIIGGPSAGAAISVLTYAQLNDLSVDTSVAMTGTINSGRLIGSVGGIKEKVDGAAKAGIKKILLPVTDIDIKQDDNTTLNMIEYGASLGIEVVAVSDLEDAIFHFTGVDLSVKVVTLDVSKEYIEIMKNISDNLCLRANEILFLINESNFNISSYESVNITYNLGLNLLNRSSIAYLENLYYSSASQCYAANNNLYFSYLLLHNNSDEYYIDRLDYLQNAVDLYISDVKDMSYNTIPSLQTAMILRQRLDEVQDYLNLANEYNFSNNSNNTFDRDYMVRNVAYAVERLYTVKLWSMFFEIDGQEYEIDDNILRESCFDIISDANTRIQYAQLYLPYSFSDREKKLNDLKSGDDYAYCIAKATIIRADVNAFIGSVSLTLENVPNLIFRKLDKAAQILSEEINSGRFPILGYSYYEYAKTLAEIESSSALIYAEYALELSNLDLYLNRPQYSSRIISVYSYKSDLLSKTVLSGFLITFLIGFLLGIMVVIEYINRKYVIKRKTSNKISIKSFKSKVRK
jgi:uncharacterized protein